MTTFVATEAVDLSSLEEFGILNAESLDTAAFAGDKSYIVVTVDDIEFKFTGSFPGVEGTPTQEDLELGTITGIDVSVEGVPRYQISSISMLGSALLGYVTADEPDAWIGDVLLAGDDTITGSIFSDTLYGYGGADTITGGADDYDTAHYTGDMADYSVVDNLDGTFSVTDLRDYSPDGADTLSDVEYLQFEDERVFLGSGPNERPEITSDGGYECASVDVAENDIVVTTVTATDPDAGDTLTYSISGGADALKFTIDASTGALRFIAAPNFEAPTDAGGDNVYDVIVRVSDGSLVDTQSIAVTVTNRNEAPSITSNGGGATATVNVLENATP